MADGLSGNRTHDCVKLIVTKTLETELAGGPSPPDATRFNWLHFCTCCYNIVFVAATQLLMTSICDVAASLHLPVNNVCVLLHVVCTNHLVSLKELLENVYHKLRWF